MHFKPVFITFTIKTWTPYEKKQKQYASSVYKISENNQEKNKMN